MKEIENLIKKLNRWIEMDKRDEEKVTSEWCKGYYHGLQERTKIIVSLLEEIKK